MGFSNQAQRFTGSNYLDVDSPLQKIFRTIRFKTEPISEQQKSAMKKTRTKFIIFNNFILILRFLNDV